MSEVSINLFNFEKQSNKGKFEWKELIEFKNVFSPNLEIEERFVKFLKEKFKKFLILGIGGSINHIKTAVDMMKLNNENIMVVSRYNRNTLADAMNFVDKDTFVLMISKNGRSVELNAFAKIVLEYFVSIDNPIPHKNIGLIATTSGAKNIDLDYDYYLMDYTQTSGRFSFFSSAFIVPMMLHGFDITSYLNGASDILNSDSKDGFASTLIESYEKGATNSVLVSHSENIQDSFFIWYEQLLMESTGKINGGLDAMFSNDIEDMHSKFQMFVDGRKNKIYTIISEDTKGENELSSAITSQRDRAMKAIKESGQIVRCLKIEKMDEYSIGCLFALIGYEIVSLCNFMGVNPFDQAGVEKMKKIEL